MTSRNTGSLTDNKVQNVLLTNPNLSFSFSLIRNQKWINLYSVIKILMFYLIYKWSRYLMTIHHLI